MNSEVKSDAGADAASMSDEPHQKQQQQPLRPQHQPPPPTAPSAHRYSCLRSKSLRSSAPQTCRDLVAAATTTADDGNNDQCLRKDILGTATVNEAAVSHDALSTLRRTLAQDVTVVRTDGSVVPSPSSGDADDDPEHAPVLVVVKTGDNQYKEAQVAALARLLGTAIVRSRSPNQSTLGGEVLHQQRHIDAEVAKAAGQAVAARAAAAQAKNNGKASTAKAEASGGFGGGIIRSAATGLASGLATVASFVWTTLNEDDENDQSLKVCQSDRMYASDEEDGMAYAGDRGTRTAMLDDNLDGILNVGIAVDCVEMVLRYALEVAENAADSTHNGAGHSYVLLHRFGTAASSWGELCRKAAAKAASTDVGNTTAAAAAATRNATSHILAHLSTADADAILLGLVGANLAGLSPDGDIVAILPRGGAVAATTATSAESSKMDSPLNEVNLAIFRLESAVSSLERRIEQLSDRVNVLQSEAVANKKEGKQSLALTKLKRRNLLRGEVDKESQKLLNLEQSLHALQRAKADAEVVKAYKLAGEALKMTRMSVEEGGLGLDVGSVENLMDSLAEDSDALGEISEMLASSSLGGPGENGTFGSEGIDEEELLKEMDQLEVDMLAEDLSSSTLNEEKNSDAVASPAKSADENDKRAENGTAEKRGDDEFKRTAVAS